MAAALLTGCMAQTDTVDAALNAYRENRIAEAETILGRLVADPSTPAAVRAQALLGIARIAAHVDDDLPRALQVLGQARQLDDSRCDAASTIARLLNRAGRDAELLAQIDALAANCSDPAERAGLLLQAAEAALDLGAAAPEREAALQRARALLDRAGEDARNGLQGSALALEIALLARDAPGALQAWRNYFWLRDTDNPQGIALGDRSAADIFALGLATGAGAEAKLHLLDLLIRAGLARPAERFAEAAALPGAAAGHPAWTRAAAYLDARRGLERDLLAANRRLARGQPAGNVRSLYDGFTARLAAAAGGGGDPTEVLRRAYGLYGLTGRTGGFPGIHLGHVVESRRQTVEQYGHRADVGFIVLDGMLANGFQSWLWEGFAATGGWTEAGPVIVQVRPEYTSSPLASWEVFSGGAARRRLVERQPQRAAADLAALAGRNVAPLGGLADRLRLQTIDQLGARARQLAGQGGDLRRAFLDEYWRATFQHSILLHEGRHAIDRTLVTGLARVNATNLEYRAKLSELALADYPRMALYNIVNGGVGDGTSHGDANAMVLDHYRRWTEANRGQVAGFEPGLPALAQIDRLTDAQIRAVARGLDPIAN
jgi:hypothetical protein